MSIEAINWVLNGAPDLPAHLFALLMGMANHADPQGEGARPSQATLAWYTRKTDRAIRNDLAEALRIGLIRHGNQRLVEHLPPDRRPIVYDLALERLRPPRDRARRGPALPPRGDGPSTVGAESPSGPMNGRNLASDADRTGGSGVPVAGGSGVPVAGGSGVPVAGGSPLPTNRPVEPSREPTPHTPRAERRPTPDSRRDEGGREDPQQTPKATQPARPAAQPADEPPAPPATTTGHHDQPATTTPADPIAATVAEAITHQPTWTRSATRAAITQAIAEGMDQAVATKALIDIATGVYGPTIAGPQRLLAAGPWRQPGTVFVPAPSPAQRATCRRHRGQLADHCRVCASERLAPPEDEPKSEPETGSDTVEEARAIARRAIQSSATRWTQVRRARTRVGAINLAT